VTVVVARSPLYIACERARVRACVALLACMPPLPVRPWLSLIPDMHEEHEDDHDGLEALGVEPSDKDADADAVRVSAVEE
jgi:hypothetical protein